MMFDVLGVDVKIEDLVRWCALEGWKVCLLGIYDFRRYSRGVSSEDSDVSTHEIENAVVACPCGVDYDDGQQMIECEKCKEWAHTTCLESLLVTLLHTLRISLCL